MQNLDLKFIAHKRKNEAGQWEFESVRQHLERVAELTSIYMEPFGLKNFGYLIGILHDIGKYTSKFYEVIMGNRTKVNHAVVGAAFVIFYSKVCKMDEALVKAASAVILAHHVGLDGDTKKFICNRNSMNDLFDFASDILNGINGDYDVECDNKVNALSSKQEMNCLVNYVFMLLNDKKFSLKGDWFDWNTKAFQSSLDKELQIFEDALRNQLFYRILLSCLVDADYTATREFCENEPYVQPDFNVDFLLDKLNEYHKQFDKPELQNGLNVLRQELYDYAGSAGRNVSSGLYTMSSPTGTGKTLAMIRFGLECAKKNGQNRVIIVLPYLSIIKQNVAVYQRIFGENFVLEDDSSVSSDKKNASIVEYEKWDVPIIVTTNVKLCEAMFASKPSVLRRFHTMANAVVIFDEVHVLPSDLLSTTTHTLQYLTELNSSVLFSSATVPFYTGRKDLGNLIWKEIVPDISSLYQKYHKLHNMEIVRLPGKIVYEDLLGQIDSNINQICFIFNTRSKAEDMYDLLTQLFSEGDCFLISGNLAKKHNLDVIEKIKVRLDEGKPCYLVSTQAIEAGVDVDFKILCREYASFVSLCQSAGRCNRECKDGGKFVLFELDKSCYQGSGYPSSLYKDDTESTIQVLDEWDDVVSFENFDLVKKYWNDFYSKYKRDNKDLVIAVKKFDFEGIVDNYKIIKNRNAISLIVPYENVDSEWSYEKIFNVLANQDFYLSNYIKSNAQNLVVSLYVSENDEEKNAFLDCCCHQLYGKYQYDDGRASLNWYIVNRDYVSDSYDIKKGVCFDRKGDFFHD